MSKFKVGDRVRRVNYDNNPKMRVGTEWVVSGFKEYCGDDYLIFQGGGDGNVKNFELVSPAYTSCAAAEVDNLADEYGAPRKFKVGDRVRYTAKRKLGFDTNMIGRVGTVTKDEGVCIGVDWDGSPVWSYGVYPDNLEHVAAPTTALRVEAGKFYKTRDGRKVGPAAHYELGKDRGWPWDVGDYILRRPDGRAGGAHPDTYDLIAEWTDEPVAAAPKFKVGDKVKNINVPEAGVGIVTEVRSDGEYQVHYKDTWYGYCTDDESDIVAAPTTIADIVARHSQSGTAIVAVLENGKPRPATRPYVHGSTHLAETEANRLARANPGKEFGVYTLGAVAKVEKTYDHEWQRLAVKPTKSDAIAEFKRLTGCTTAQASRIVYDFAKAA